MAKEIELWATMVTPFTNEGKVDYDNIEKIVQWYVENGLTGIFAVCQSSEMFFFRSGRAAGNSQESIGCGRR